MRDKETQAVINKMLDRDYTDYEIAKFITDTYFLKGYSLDDFAEDLIFTYNLTETATENLVDKAREILANKNKGKEIIQQCKKCKTVFKITIIESDVAEPLSYTASCPSCGGSGIYEIEEVK